MAECRTIEWWGGWNFFFYIALFFNIIKCSINL
jgi:hypothetical protein